MRYSNQDCPGSPITAGFSRLLCPMEKPAEQGHGTEAKEGRGSPEPPAATAAEAMGESGG